MYVTSAPQAAKDGVQNLIGATGHQSIATSIAGSTPMVALPGSLTGLSAQQPQHSAAQVQAQQGQTAMLLAQQPVTTSAMVQQQLAVQLSAQPSGAQGTIQLQPGQRIVTAGGMHYVTAPSGGSAAAGAQHQVVQPAGVQGHPTHYVVATPGGAMHAVQPQQLMQLNGMRLAQHAGGQVLYAAPPGSQAGGSPGQVLTMLTPQQHAQATAQAQAQAAAAAGVPSSTVAPSGTPAKAGGVPESPNGV